MAKTKLWGGRFSVQEDPFIAEFNRSLSFDRELLEFDVRGSQAYARALERAGVLTGRECSQLERGLRAILKEHRDNPDLIKASTAEDVHTYVELALEKRVGPLALKLHTGRSRNDQVATDLRLFLREEAGRIENELNRLLETIAALAERHPATPMPGYTHLQRAQPVLFAHHALAYGEMFLRDRQRLREAKARIDVCPLGSGALSGTVYEIDRDRLARELGFACSCDNSMDGVSDRDFVLDFLSFASILVMHLSRLAEDLILFNSTEFGFITLDDSVASGSSLMPQKKNPDALELLRGKAGRVFGHLLALLTVLKGLPMTYNKDLQEDKEGLFDVVATVESCLRIAGRILETMRVQPERMRQAAADGYMNATELADYLVAKGMPFREAHRLAGKIVLRALDLGRRLEDLSLKEYRSFSPLFGSDLYDCLNLETAICRRRERGGTAFSQVKTALRRFRRKIAT